MSQIQITDLNTQDFFSNLTPEELTCIQGGGWAKEAWDFVNEGWTDIKKGVVDGWKGN